MMTRQRATAVLALPEDDAATALAVRVTALDAAAWLADDNRRKGLGCG
jgi:hypothetical protein